VYVDDEKREKKRLYNNTTAMHRSGSPKGWKDVKNDGDDDVARRTKRASNEERIDNNTTRMTECPPFKM
jgi:hypothetical protein